MRPAPHCQWRFMHGHQEARVDPIEASEASRQSRPLRAASSRRSRVPPDMRTPARKDHQDGQKTFHTAIKEVSTRLDRTARQADLDRAMKRLDALQKQVRRIAAGTAASATARPARRAPATRKAAPRKALTRKPSVRATTARKPVVRRTARRAPPRPRPRTWARCLPRCAARRGWPSTTTPRPVMLCARCDRVRPRCRRRAAASWSRSARLPAYPMCCEQSGATLVEVGTTNRTHSADYERAAGADTRCDAARPPVELPHRRLHRSSHAWLSCSPSAHGTDISG